MEQDRAYCESVAFGACIVLVSIVAWVLLWGPGLAWLAPKEEPPQIVAVEEDDDDDDWDAW